MAHVKTEEYVESLQTIVESVLSKLDFDYYAVCSINANDFGLCNSLPIAHTTNYPNKWLNHYILNQLHNFDPVMYFGRMVSYPVSWEKLELASGFSKDHRSVLNCARDFGLRSGICMSIHNLDGSLMIVSLASSGERTLNNMVIKEAANSVQALSTLGPSPAAIESGCFDLTQREVECLSWCALGKTSNDISAILEISSNTVDFHLKSAMRKLSASSRTFAIVKAMRNGIIPL